MTKSGLWQTIAAVVAVGGATALAVYAVTGTDADCVAKAGPIATATLLYAQDYDEKLPQMTNAVAFTRAVAPYVREVAPPPVGAAFTCPATNAAYVPNAPYSGLSLAAIPDVADAEVLRDGPPHADGKRTVAFFDGHVERGGVDQAEPTAACISNLKKISQGLASYAQDYDEQLPLATTLGSTDSFRAVVKPYVGSNRYFVCPDTQLPYKANAAVGGRSLWSFGDADARYAVEVARDPSPHVSDGETTVAFLDGHIERGGVDQTDPDARALADVKRLATAVHIYLQDYDGKLPPLVSQTAWENAVYPYTESRRVFRNAETNLPYRRNLALNGLSQNNFPDPANTVLLRDAAPHRSKRESLAFLDGHAREICAWFETNRDGKTDLLWQNDTTRAVALWRMDRAARIGFETFTQTPGADWFPAATCDADQDGDPDILWRNRVTGALLYAFMNYGSGKAVQERSASLASPGADMQIAGAPDVDGDGWPDLVFRNTASGDIVVWRVRNAVRIGTETPFARFDKQWKLVAFPDLNNDLSPDWVLQNARTGAVAYWLMNGTARVGSGYLINSLALEWQVQGRYDINQDNKPDLLLRNTQTGALVCWRLNGTLRTGTQTVTTGVPLAWKLVGLP